MVMRAIGSFHYSETRFISRGCASGNKPGQGGMDTTCIRKYPYFNCFIVPIQYMYVRSFTLVEFFL